MLFRRIARFARESWLWVAALILWIGGIGGGMYLLARHDVDPGAPAAAPATWPADSKIARATDMPTLLLFVHPHCPCTRASVGEFERLVARRPDTAQRWIVCLQPPGADEAWCETDLLTTVQELPDTRIYRDLGGAEARRFGVHTSGQALLYNATGGLQFAGGITHARGHAGDNDGRQSLEAALAGEPPPLDHTPVYGCPLTEEDTL